MTRNWRFNRRHSLIVLAVISIPVLIWAGGRRWLSKKVLEPTNDPRLNFDSPFLNVHPDVKYVGAGACAACHSDQAVPYRRHPMGQSLAPVADSFAIERFDPAHQNPFTSFGFQFLVEQRGGKQFHKEIRLDPHGASATEYISEIAYALGSGTRARSYLIDRQGYLFESAITWYSQKGIWDLSPGFEANPHSDRPITADCLFCHSNHAEAVDGPVNRYRSPIFEGYAIGCERCHGPGELHVARRERGESTPGPDNTIVNPARLQPSLRDAVCEQCHLQGAMRILHPGRKSFDYRPGMPWQLFWSVFVKTSHAPDTQPAVGQVEQMHASRCYSGGKLLCTSCHDPHMAPEQATRTDYYRRRCLTCHAQGDCSRPVPKGSQRDTGDSISSDCISCHMPRSLSSDVAHTAITDHRILRRPKSDVGKNPKSEAQNPKQIQSTKSQISNQEVSDIGASDLGFVSDFGFRISNLAIASDRGASQDAIISRARGLALTRWAESGRADQPSRSRLTKEALPLLDEAVKNFPDDVATLRARGYALWQQNRHEEAGASFQAGLRLAPENETTLIYAASLAAEMGQVDQAVGLWQRAVQINPWTARSHFELARLFIIREEWASAVDESREVLRLNPFHTEARKILIVCYQQMRDPQNARAEFRRLMELNPPNPQMLQQWFDQLRR
jgi:predicted CXXCH cytochrome family protein